MQVVIIIRDNFVHLWPTDHDFSFPIDSILVWVLELVCGNVSGNVWWLILCQRRDTDTLLCSFSSRGGLILYFLMPIHYCILCPVCTGKVSSPPPMWNYGITLVSYDLSNLKMEIPWNCQDSFYATNIRSDKSEIKEGPSPFPMSVRCICFFCAFR